MPISQASNAWTVGLHKQTNEATIGTISDYTTGVFSGRPMPMQDTAVVSITDAATIQGDTFKNAGEHWEATIEHPAWDNMLGLELVSMWPLDTATGTAPTKSHAFTTLGAVPAFVSMYSSAPGSLQETFGKGLCSGIEFSFSASERPLRIKYSAVGQTPTVAAFTSTVSTALTDGFFTALGGTLKFEEDSLTPVAQTNIVGGTVSVLRPVTPVQTADGVTVAYLAQGMTVPTIHLDLVWANWDAYRATYYGAVAGTSASATFPTASVELNFVHTLATSSSTFKLAIDKCKFLTTPPEPNPDASPLMVSVDLAVDKPASGDHVKPTLINNVTPAY